MIAKSYEMKAYGVKTGTPIWEAIKLCPEGIYIKRDFRWYEVISRQMLSLLKEVSPLVEYYSIDEMFFDARELTRIYGEPIEHALFSLQEQIREQIGIPVSIGAAPTKTLAKLGSDAAKPYGCKVVSVEDRLFLKSQAVEELCGIGSRSAAKLHQAGIHTCEDYTNADRLQIRKMLTIKGEALWYELQGEPVQKLLPERPNRKAISRGGSIGKKTCDPEVVTAWLVRNTERLVEALRENQMNTESLTLSLEFSGVTGWSRTTKLPEPTSSFELLVNTAKRLLAQAPQVHITSHMHLIAEKLTPKKLVQKMLWNQSSAVTVSRENSEIEQLKQEINHKVGRFAVRSGETLALQGIYEDTANDYDICDVDGKLCF